MAPPIVKRYLISLERNVWLGLLVWLIVTGIAAVIAMQPQPARRLTYKGLGQLAFRTPPPAFTSTGADIQQQSRILSLSSLLARPILERVRDKLKWTDQEVIQIIQSGQFRIIFPDEGKPKGKGGGDTSNNTGLSSPSRVITLEYNDEKSPTRVILVLDAFMQEMVRYNKSQNALQLQGRIDALKERLAQAQNELTKAEEKFYSFISKDGSDLLAVQDGSLFSGITSSQQQQREIKLILKDIEGQIASLTKQLGLNAKQAYTSSALSADPIIGDLRVRILDNELQMERLKQDLRPEHPSIVKLEKDKKVNEQLLQQRAQEIIGKDGILVQLPKEIRQDSNLDPARQQLANQLVSLQIQRDGIKEQLLSVVKNEKELKQQYEKFPTKQIQQAKLVQGVEFQRVIYQNILTALVDAQSAEAESVSSLTIAQKAELVPNPLPNIKKVNKIIIILAGASAGLVLGAGAIFLLSVIDNRLHSASEIQDTLASREISILGQIPWMNSPEGLLDPILIDGDPLQLAFYERLRSNIRRIKSDSSVIILVTSVEPGEGKSVTAYNLAIAAAHAGKRALLIEADLSGGSHSLAPELGIVTNTQTGLEPLRYYADRNNSITLVPEVENLYILPSPGPQRQSAAILESNELQLLIKDARGRFDVVILDTPSVSISNDAFLLEPLTDGILLVTRPSISRGKRLIEAIDQIIEAELPLFGVVINGIEELTVSPDNNVQKKKIKSDYRQEPSEESKVEV